MSIKEIKQNKGGKEQGYPLRGLFLQGVPLLKARTGAFFGGLLSQKKRPPVTVQIGVLAPFFLSALFFSFSYTSALTTKSSTPTNLPSNGLVLHHTFDGKRMTTSTSTDSSTRGNNGTLIGTPGRVLGKLGQALSFNGSTQYVVTNASADFNFTDQVSVSVWLKPGATQGTYADILGNHSYSYGGFVIEQDTNNTNLYYFAWGNGTFYTCGPSTGFLLLNANVWQHVVFVKSGATVRGYINGVESGSCTGAFSAINSTIQPLTIGRFAELSERHWNGSMDDLRVYNRALTAREIAQLSGVKVRAQAPNTSPALSLNTNLVGWWTFDGVDTNTSTTTDKSSRGNNGALLGTPLRSTGKIGQALSFNGSTQYITTNASTDFNFTDQVSVSVWLKPGATQGAYADIFSKHSSSFGGFALEQNNASTNSYYFGWGNGASYTCGEGSPLFTLTANVWQHVMVVKSGTTVRGYVNGVETGSCTGSFSSIGTNADIFTIGRWASTNNRYWSGVMDDFRIYNRALTTNEISALSKLSQNVASFGVAATSSLPVSNGLVGHWTLDGKTISTTGATTSAQDLVGGFNGTFTNMSTTTSRVLGKLGQAITFDGVNDYISMGTSSQLANKPFSVSFWAKSNVTTETWDSPIGKVNNAGWSAGWGFFTQGTSEMRFFVEGYTTNLAAFSNLNPQLWHHYVGVWDGTNVYIYVDGVRGETADTYTGTMTAQGPIFIGSIEASNNYNWNGPIDDVRIYNRGLSQEEVRTLYKMGGI